MKYIHYDNSAIMTGSDIADAVVEYAAVLGANGRTDTVHVPTFDENGMVMYSTMLIGPASQIVVDDAPDDELEPEDPQFVERLRSASRELSGSVPVHADGTPDFGHGGGSGGGHDDGARGGAPSGRTAATGAPVPPEQRGPLDTL